MNINDIIGNNYNMLTVLSLNHIEYNDKRKENYYYYDCICDCGNKTIVERGRLIRNVTHSCGCLQKKNVSLAKRKLNKYDIISFNYGIGWTTNTNKEFYFDLEDYNKIKNLCWCENDQGYIITKSLNTKTAIRLHRYILNIHNQSNPIIDHINNNRNDNRKNNLRLATPQTNQINRGANINNKLGIKGIAKSKTIGKYIARIMVNGKNIHLGTFNTLENAIKARKEAEEKYFGEFAYKN
jgi:hypothetical protein